MIGLTNDFGFLKELSQNQDHYPFLITDELKKAHKDDQKLQ